MAPHLRAFKNVRGFHRWGAIGAAAPIFVIVVTGILLLVKKDVPSLQPPTRHPQSKEITLGFSEILGALRKVPKAEVASWDDVERLDVWPSQGLIKVRAKNHYEIQLDGGTGEVLSVAYRWSSLVIALHTGTWFHRDAPYFVFLPAALILLGLWGTGLWLFVWPYRLRRQRSASRQNKSSDSCHKSLAETTC